MDLEKILWHSCAITSATLGVILTYKNAVEGEYFRLLEVDIFFALSTYLAAYKTGYYSKPRNRFDSRK